MAENLNALTDSQVVRLGKMLKWFEANGGFQITPQRRALEGPIEYKIGKPSSDIVKFGSGAIVEYTLGGTSTFIASTNTETAFDWFGTGAQSTDRVMFWRHQKSGKHIFLYSYYNFFGCT